MDLLRGSPRWSNRSRWTRRSSICGRPPRRSTSAAPGLRHLVAELKPDVAEVTGGMTASVGVASSKFLAKVATELAKPDGCHIVEPGTEVAMLRADDGERDPGGRPGHRRRSCTGSGSDRGRRLQGFSVDELAQVVGRTHAQSLTDLAYARDDRAVEPERETKSISAEDTFETDLADLAELRAVLHRDARQVAGRLTAAGLFARTVSIKVRLPDFSTFTRSRTLLSATDGAEVIGAVAVACSARSTRPVAYGCSASGSPGSPTCGSRTCSPTTK